MFEHDWERAEASIVAKAVAMKWGLELAEGLLDYVVDVRPVGRPAFRTKVRGSIGPHFMDPLVGDIVPVLIQPKGEKAKFDTDDPIFSTLARANSCVARLDEIAEQAPGSPISDPYGRPTVFNQGRDQVATAERLGALLSSDPEQQRAAAEALRAASTSGAGGPVVLDLRGIVARGGVPGSPPVPSDDPAPRFQQLAALHQAGLVTDDEYATQRRRILG